MPINPLVDVSSLVQDITGGSGTSVTSVGATAPITSTGGTTPTIGITTPLAVQYGGSAAATFVAGYVKSPGGTTALTTQATPIPIADGGTGTGVVPANNSVIYTAAGAYTGDATKLYFDGTSAAVGAVSGAKTATLEVSSQSASNEAIRVRANGFAFGTMAFTDATGATEWGSLSSTASALTLIGPTGGTVATAPSTPLTVNGYLATAQGAVVLANGLNSNTVPPATSFIRATGPTLAFSLGGFTGGVDGRKMTLYNTTSQTMTIVNEDASSTATNRITTLTGANVILAAGSPSVAEFTYDGTALRWIYTEPQAGNHTGTGTAGQVTFWTGASAQSGDNGLFWDNVNKRLGVGNTTPAAALSVGAANQLQLNGIAQLGATWDYGKTYSITGRNSVDWINVAEFATGGSGTSGSPWTGWDTAITWTAGQTYVFPNVPGTNVGYYSYAASPAWGLAGIRLIGNGFGELAGGTGRTGTVIVNTGTGKVADFSSASVITGILVQDITFQGNASSADHGIYVTNAVGHTFRRVRSNGAATAAMYWANVQGSILDNFVSSSNYAAYPKTPQYGIYLANGAGGSTTNEIINPQIVGTTIAGIFTETGSFCNDFHNGAVQGNTGRGVSNAGYANTFDTMDFEGNTGTDDILLTTGSEDVQIRNCRLMSTGVTNAITISPGAGRSNNIIDGGTSWRTINIASGTGNAVIGKHRYNRDIGGNPISDSGVGTTFDCYDFSTNFPLIVPGVNFSQTADSTTTANTLTTLLGTGTGTKTIPAGILNSGRNIRVRIGGYVSVADGGAGTKTLTVTLGGTTVATGTSGATIGTLLSQQFMCEVDISCRAGVVQAGGRWYTQIAANGGSSGVWAASTATTAITFSSAQAVDVKFNNGNATGTITTTYATVEIL